ncbi:hypothetical protein D5R81_13990 [Parashewanella spongiae]|uniref:DUF2974 domain-containing protein n=1 Tax=Parashewanella spongiae TaxID=342950 RepID=A0A3A6U0U2_9GAMM|nr:hypothetical protein [Parashewanella spongiae]MCL1079120.1 hypothetical protein [Parashewanella spongiae]RJY10721.1 hypothetical protein D5R81_13990 [Parashewanella spongiae]
MFRKIGGFLLSLIIKGLFIFIREAMSSLSVSFNSFRGAAQIKGGQVSEPTDTDSVSGLGSHIYSNKSTPTPFRQRLIGFFMKTNVSESNIQAHQTPYDLNKVSPKGTLDSRVFSGGSSHQEEVITSPIDKKPPYFDTKPVLAENQVRSERVIVKTNEEEMVETYCFVSRSQTQELVDVSDFEVITLDECQAAATETTYKTFTHDDIKLAAELSQSAYRDSKFIVRDGVEEIMFNIDNKDSFDFGFKKEDFYNEHLKFKAKLFWDRNENRLILAFRGSESLTHIGVSVNQAVTGASTYYELGMLLARMASEIAVQNGLSLLYVGHSLGGGLACACTQVTGNPAITFNAASITSQTIQKFISKNGGEKFAPTNLVLACSTEGDILTNVLRITGREASGTQYVLNGSGKRLSIKDHRMATVREGIASVLN